MIILDMLITAFFIFGALFLYEAVIKGYYELWQPAVFFFGFAVLAALRIIADKLERKP